MYQIPEMLYNEKMPPRAKKLFVKTFTKYHKMNGGDEDVAMHKAKNALEQKYVKVNALQNSWIPRKAAYEIVKDDFTDDESDNDSGVDNIKKSDDRFDETTDYDTEDDYNNFNNKRQQRGVKRKSKKNSTGKITTSARNKQFKQNTFLPYDTDTLSRYYTSEDEDKFHY
ncbi:hypothetical protein [Palpita vitrealis nucleopolyhedrovirus]|uniref:Ac58/ac59 n=1 Tax=Palpita vitrealis nucleopolyhedrovirus TaxID=2951960 RepID=A0AAE9LNH4_9ABAC|nr:hypothetical protein [Palpita vitrealis nucleopolyhedrovirus]